MVGNSAEDKGCGSVATCVLRSSEFDARVRQISSTFGLPMADVATGSDYKYALKIEGDVLKLVDLASPKFRPISMKINSLGRLSRKSHLGRAVGRKVKHIIDGTAGLGGDSLLLARMGYRVTAVERSPIFAALVEDGIRQIANRNSDLLLEPIFADTQLLLSELDPRPDAIYLDPMFPEGRKSSVKIARPLEVLRDICGDDVDTESLLETALQTATRRVIVKRPNFAEPIRKERLTTSMLGKLVRYDVYAVNG